MPRWKRDAKTGSLNNACMISHFKILSQRRPAAGRETRQLIQNPLVLPQRLLQQQFPRESLVSQFNGFLWGRLETYHEGIPF